MRGKTGLNIVVNLDKRTLAKVPAYLAKVGFIRFNDDVLNEVRNYIPMDTESMVDQNYLIRDMYSVIIGYGSLSDDRINKIIIRQHEEALFHYGNPGKSMRTGVPGASIPGVPYIAKGVVRHLSNNIRRQKNDYNRGYMQKRKAHLLTKYKSMFLDKAVTSALRQGVNGMFNGNEIRKDTPL